MDAESAGHLRLLSIFHYVLAGLGGLASLLPVLHIALGVAMLTGSLGPDENAPPEAFGWLFVGFGAFVMLMGFGCVALFVIAGRSLARRRHWTLCMVVAAIACAFFPIGTALGVLTIVVLAKPQVKAAFGEVAGAPPAPSAPSP